MVMQKQVRELLLRDEDAENDVPLITRTRHRTHLIACEEVRWYSVCHVRVLLVRRSDTTIH